MKPIKMTNNKREQISGYLFILPWIMGFVFLFLRPMISSLIYSFSDVSIEEGFLRTQFTGFDKYLRAFMTDADTLPALTKSISDLLYQVPLIVMFSLFIALILNQKFKGRLFVRAVFFLPVIIASGVIIDILKDDLVSQMFLAGSKSSNMIQITVLRDIMLEAGFSGSFVSQIIAVINNIFELSWKSGIQILLFIAGLQTIPAQLYEVAKIEGSTGWESFWKVTFPLISPILLLNIVYTIIDSFVDHSNEFMQIIIKYARSLDFSYSSALAWIYFIVIAVILVVVYSIINRRTFYANE
ncbi:sugar ABC transporter permease [Candidatus Nomurabacteria bacterium]|nr:sugar ABC transporter permease [Candidatus Nomurabacteria bacterium]